MTSWHLNTWTIKNLLSQEWNKFSKWNKKHFFFFHKYSLLDIQKSNKNVVGATLKPTENRTFSIYDPLRIKLLNGLAVNFSHLKKHKFRHNSAGTLNTLCSCPLETESTAHFFLLCYSYNHHEWTKQYW